jgi:hypothetical protein
MRILAIIPPDDRRVAEIQQQFDAAGAARGGRRHVHVVHHELLRLRRPVDRLDHEVDLMDVEGVDLRGVVLDRPLFDRSALGVELRRSRRIVRQAVIVF